MKPTARTICFSGTAVVFPLLAACASPVEGLWPPSPNSTAHTIYVSIDTWHAMIAFPHENGSEGSGLWSERNSSDLGLQSSALGPQHFYEEWGYAERAWYLEGKSGLSGILRALFWPTDGVVEVGHYDRVWAERTPQPPSDLFGFRLTDESHQRLRRHLHATLLSEELVVLLGQSKFYPAKRLYHLFHTCHQYAAQALREAGLPISVSWAFNRTSLAWQLRRAARMSGEQATGIPDEGGAPVRS